MSSTKGIFHFSLQALRPYFKKNAVFQLELPGLPRCWQRVPGCSLGSSCVVRAHIMMASPRRNVIMLLTQGMILWHFCKTRLFFHSQYHRLCPNVTVLPPDVSNALTSFLGEVSMSGVVLDQKSNEIIIWVAGLLSTDQLASGRGTYHKIRGSPATQMALAFVGPVKVHNLVVWIFKWQKTHAGWKLNYNWEEKLYLTEAVIIVCETAVHYSLFLLSCYCIAL